jgi:hypothetical protein
MCGDQASRFPRVTPRQRAVPIHWIGSPKRVTGWGMVESPSGSAEDDRRALGDLDSSSPVTQPPFKGVEVRLQVADEQRWLAGRDYDGRVARVKGQLDMV